MEGRQTTLVSMWLLMVSNHKSTQLPDHTYLSTPPAATPQHHNTTYLQAAYVVEALLLLLVLHQQRGQLVLKCSQLLLDLSQASLCARDNCLFLFVKFEAN